MAGVGQKLEIRQGLGLVMTPQLQQAIKLLQLSNIELADYCEQELERNPLLERDEGPVEAATEPPQVETKSEALDTELAREDFSKIADLDTAQENIYDGATPAPTVSEQNAPLSDWATVQSGNAYEGDEAPPES